MIDSGVQMNREVLWLRDYPGGKNAYQLLYSTYLSTSGLLCASIVIFERMGTVCRKTEATIRYNAIMINLIITYHQWTIV